MSYKVLARKWRPQTFSEVVGQAHITLTLQNAIKKDRIGHAYLFVGPRGIGKTTTARIFAKALNCSNPKIDTEGKSEPCCECDTCQEIANSNCLDVIEIDGASNNKVDDIRGLRETVPYAPTNGRRYKIYIIDEVHMLTTGAWNALLKTLEEPPAHVKFLFATTEAHKVLPTIVSRCQRFDLKRISVQLIIDQLRKIAEKESIFVAEKALAVIARAADGGMRDAQSILDQMIAFCGGNSSDAPIKEEDVIDVFGLTSNADLKRLALALLDNHAGNVINTLHFLADNGRNLERLYADLLSYFRTMLVFHYAANPESIVELSESELDEYQSLKPTYLPGTIQRMLEGLMAYESNMRNYLNKRIFIEVTLLRVMREAHSITVDTLITRLREFQKREALPSITQTENEGMNLEIIKPDNFTEEKMNPETPAPPKVLIDSDNEESGPNHLKISKVRKNSDPPADKELLQNVSEKKNIKSALIEPKNHDSITESSGNSVGNTNLLHLESENTDQPEKHDETLSRKEIWESLEKDEFVQSICNLFKGKIVDVRGKKQ